MKKNKKLVKKDTRLSFGLAMYLFMLACSTPILALFIVPLVLHSMGKF